MPRPPLARFDTTVALDPSWRLRAACRGLGYDPFFLRDGDYDRGAGKITKLAVTTLRTCQGCPVARECLIYAVTTNTRHGIWGGMTPAARRQWARAHGWRKPADVPADLRLVV